MQRLAKPNYNDNKQKKQDKIHKDEMDSYKTNPKQDDIEVTKKEMDVCEDCGQEIPKGARYEYHDDKNTKFICNDCYEENYKNQLSEDEKQGKQQAEKIQQQYNLSNSYNADEIEEPNLRNYVQALLNYYNSWGDYDEGYIRFCERALEKASEEFYQFEQKNKKANRIILRLKKLGFRTPNFSDNIDLSLDIEGVAKSLNDLAKKVKGIEDFDPDDVTQFSQILEQVNQDIQALIDIANDQVNGHDVRIDKSKPYSNIW